MSTGLTGLAAAGGGYIPSEAGDGKSSVNKPPMSVEMSTSKAVSESAMSLDVINISMGALVIDDDDIHLSSDDENEEKKGIVRKFGILKFRSSDPLLSPAQRRWRQGSFLLQFALFCFVVFCCAVT